MKKIILLLTTAILHNVAIAQWTGHSRPNPNASSGLIASDGTNLYCSADGIFKSTDNGTTWNNMTPGETINFKTMVFDGNGNIYATGFVDNTLVYPGYILSSADNGQTWSYDTLGLGEHFIGAIYYDAVSNRVFTTHRNNSLNQWQKQGLYYKTAGSGVNTPWVKVSNYGNNTLHGMTSIGSTLFAIDNTHTIKKSTDNGDTWTPVAASGIGSAVYNGNGDSGFRGLLAVSNTLFIILSDGLYKSTDNGETFTQSGNGIDVNSQGVPRVSMLYHAGNYLYAGGGSMGAKPYRSSDLGVTWADMGTVEAANQGFMVNRRIDAFAMHNGNLFGASSLPTDSVLVFQSATTSISETENLSSLIKIYPNPANDFVTISNLSNESTITVTDITGKTLFSSITNNEQTTISTADFVGGVYIIRITNNGTVIKRKLVVNK
jgi:hypothetical protein